MGHRLPQLNELIRQTIGEFFLKEITWPENCIATITKVITSRDLSQSKIFVSILPVDQHTPVIKLLNSRARFLQHLLAGKLIIRKVPKIVFFFDDSQEKAAHIDELIDKIHQQG
jgi:ribosome-binding factor A